MRQYLELLEDILVNGEKRTNRTGIETLAVFGRQVRYDLREGFPLVTTRKIFFKGVKGELLWFLEGGTNIKGLHKYGVTFWDQWAREDGDLGPVYGAQWIGFGARKELVPHVHIKEGKMNVKGSSFHRVGGVDQIAKAIKDIRENPDSRRIIVSAWNPVDIPSMALPPCHLLFQFNVDRERGFIDLQLYQRSATSAFMQ